MRAIPARSARWLSPGITVADDADAAGRPRTGAGPEHDDRLTGGGVRCCVVWRNPDAKREVMETVRDRNDAARPGRLKVCIVGAAGKLGRYMVRHALDRGYEVVGVCREASVGKLDAFKDRITIMPGATDDRDVIK